MAEPNQELLPAPGRAIHAVALRNPFGSRKDPFQFQPGLTITEILEIAELRVGEPYHVIVLIDGFQVPTSMFDKVRPKYGSSLVCQVVPHGGRTGKAVLGIVIGVGLAVFSAGALAGVGPLVGTSTLGLVGGVVSGGLLVYSGVTSLLAPAPTTPFSGEIATSSQSPALLGSGNRIPPKYSPVPRQFGQYLRFPDYAARPYTELVGSDFYLRLLFSFGFGPLQLTDLKIGDTPIDELAEVTYNVLPGYDDDGDLEIFTSSVDETDLSVTLEDGVAIGTRNTAVDTHEVSLDFTFPAGLITIRASDGDPKHVEVELLVQYRDAGSSDPWIDVVPETLGPGVTSTVAGQVFFKGKVRGSITRGIAWKFPAAGQYEINVQRVDTDYGTSNRAEGSTAEECVWARMRSIRPGTKPRVPNLCMVEMRVKATDQLSGQIQDFNAIATSILPVWSSGEPLGDGWGPDNKLSTNTTLQATRNPAWAFAEAYRGSHNPRPVGNDRMDPNSIALWADRNVSEGIYFDAVVDFESTIGQVAQDIAGTARAAPALIDGRYGVVIDQVKDVIVGHYSQRDTSNFSATKVFQRPVHAMRVGWVNPAAGYQPDEIVVYADGYDEGSAEIFGRLDLWGITDSTRAWKDARYHMAAKALRPEIYSFDLDVASLVLTRGDRFRFSQDVMLVGTGSGRITQIAYFSGNIISVTIDQMVVFDPAKEYGVRIRTASGETLSFKIQNTTEESNIFAVVDFPPGVDVSSMTVPPAKGDLVSVGEFGRETGDYIVHSVTPGADLGARIEAVDYSPAIYTADTGTIPPFDPNITDPRPVPLQVPERPTIDAIASDESVLLVQSDGTLIRQIHLSVSFPPNSGIPISHLQGQYRLADPVGEWRSLSLIDARTHAVTFSDVDQGATYDVRVRGVAESGRASQWVTIFGHVVIGSSSPPPDVVDFRADGSTRLSWSYENPPRDFAGFKLRHQAGTDVTWTTGIPFHDGLLTATFVDIEGLQAGQRTFLLKAVDQSGNESTNAAILVKTIETPEFDNVLETKDFHGDGFVGSKTNATVEGGSGDLIADEEPDNFWGDDAQTFWKADGTTFWDQGFRAMTYSESWTPPGASVPNRMTIAATVTGNSWALKYRENGATNWLTWPGSIIAEASTTYDFQVTTMAGNIEGRISQLEAQIDVDDVVELVNDLVVASTGTVRPTLNKSFTTIKNVVLTIQNDGNNGVYGIVHDKSTSGPSVTVHNVSGTRVTGLIDMRIEGY